MFTKEDRAALNSLADAVARLVAATSEQKEQITKISSKLDEALENKGVDLVQSGISAIMNFTGTPRKGDGN